MYIIFTKNRFNQVLLFASKRQAEIWAVNATTWDSDRVSKEIIKIKNTWTGHMTVCSNINDFIDSKKGGVK